MWRLLASVWRLTFMLRWPCFVFAGQIHRSHEPIDPRRGGGQHFSSKQTRARRQRRTREAVFDVVLGELGWLSVSMIEIKGMWGYQKVLQHGKVR